MKWIAALVAFVVLFPLGYVLWPYDKLALGLDAGSRVEEDLYAGYSTALSRTREVEAVVRREHPELGRATHAWSEVRCGIDDLVTQFPTGDFRQECSLRSVWLVPVRLSRWDTCAAVHDLYGTNDPEGDATASLVRARTADLGSAAEPWESCPVVGPEPVEWSPFIYGTAYARLVSGRWPSDLQESPSWKVFEVDVFLSDTEIGCRPAFGFCTSMLKRPSMDGVDRLVGTG